MECSKIPLRSYRLVIIILMKAVILVGGEGTRLRPLTYTTVKAMVPILNRPFIQYLVQYLSTHNINDVILAMGYKPDTMRKYFTGISTDSKITYSVEDTPLGTAGAVKHALKHLSNETTFFVFNGDIFTDLDLTGMLKYHKMNNAKVTIALTPVDDPTQFGVVELDMQQRIIRFCEKPSREEAPGNLINAGTYIIENEVLNYIPQDRYCMFEHDIFPQLISDGVPVYGYTTDIYWIDMGTPGKYFRLNCDLLNSKSSLVNHSPETTTIDNGCTVHTDTRLTAPLVIDKDCVIGKGVELTGPCIIGRNCTIRDNTQIENSILWKNITVGENAIVRNCIITNDCVIKNKAYFENSILYRTKDGDQLTMQNWQTN
jgi:mannose-1-phosphate guanylyltransferase